MHLIHGRVAYSVNRIDSCTGRQIFQNYWDKCLRSERNIWTHFNYIHHNPVKHGYVKYNGDYQYSSYNFYKDKYGAEFL